MTKEQLQRYRNLGRGDFFDLTQQSEDPTWAFNTATAWGRLGTGHVWHLSRRMLETLDFLLKFTFDFWENARILPPGYRTTPNLRIQYLSQRAGDV
jgi:hypothetical protein